MYTCFITLYFYSDVLNENDVEAPVTLIIFVYIYTVNYICEKDLNIIYDTIMSMVCEKQKSEINAYYF